MRLLNRLMVVLFISGIGCTRPVDSGTVILTFSASEKVSMTAEQVEAVFVNVTGPGIATPIVWEWFSPYNCTGAACLPPATITLPIPVPKGQDRLVQYLAAVKSEQGGLIFKYADRSVSLEKAEETVDLNPTNIGASSLMGEVQGRYLDGSANGGPSGMIEGRFVPPNGRPAMLFTRAPMMAGWFKLFFLDGDAKFSYSLGGTEIFKNMNLDSPEFSFDSTTIRAAAFQIPQRYHRYLSWDEQTQTQNEVVEMNPAERLIVGFFGPGVSQSQRVCYSGEQDRPLENLYQSDADGSDNVYYHGSVDATDASSVRPLAGGDPYSTSDCLNQAEEFNTHLKFYPEELGHGGDSIAAFRPPFRASQDQAGGLQFVIPDHDQQAETLTLRWWFLPGVTNGAMRVAGVTPMARLNPPQNNHEIYGDSGVRCSALSSMGFLAAGEDVLTAADQVEATTTLNNMASLDSLQLVICPFTMVNGQKQYLDAGMEVYFWGSNEGGGGYENPDSGTAPRFTVYGPYPEITNGFFGPVEFDVFYENVDSSTIELDASDITIMASSGVSCSVIEVIAAGYDPLVRIVSFNECSGTGEVRFSIAAGTATNSAGQTVPGISSAGPFYVDNAGPNPPTNVTMSTPTSGPLLSSPTIAFDESTDVGQAGVEYYQIKIVRASDNEVVQDWTFHYPGTSISGLNLSWDTDYAFMLRAVDMVGNAGLQTDPMDWRTPDPCPTGYVLVPAMAGYTPSDICVAKYEAKSTSGSSPAQSVPTGFPWTNINRASAITACQANGPGYDLITNDEWQAVARNIESVSLNWSGGFVGSGSLNRGHSDSAPSNPIATTANDGDACYATGQSCSSENWDSQRRTFMLSNQKIIWDFAGNAMEWVTDESTSNYGNDMMMAQLSDPVAKDKFGPYGNYAALSTVDYGGLGRAIISTNAGGIIRGGSFSAQVNSGVFYVALSLAPSSIMSYVGFRCVYHPGP